VYLFVGTSDFRPQLQALRDMARERAFGDGKICKRYLCNDHYTPWHG